MSPGPCVRCTTGPAWYLCTCPEDCGYQRCSRRMQAQRDFLSARSRRRAATVITYAAEGHTAAWIVARTGLSLRTVYRYLKEGKEA